jgi:hypothetical protein
MAGVMCDSGMRKWAKVRRWINRDNGRIYQGGNCNLNAMEIIGWLFFIVSMLSYLFTEKALANLAWQGWSTLAVSVILIIIGASKNENNRAKT